LKIESGHAGSGLDIFIPFTGEAAYPLSEYLGPDFPIWKIGAFCFRLKPSSESFFSKFFVGIFILFDVYTI